VHPFVSVIVLNYNGLKHLAVVLASLEAQSYDRSRFEIILADNASADSSVAFTREHFPNVVVDILDQNYGFADGNNKAARKARADVLAFLNNDTEADTKWLEELVRAYEHEPTGIYGSQAYNFFKRDFSANSVAKLTAWGIPTNVNVYRRREELADVIQPTMYADAAGMLISKQIFFELGGFDPSYFAYEEEKDLGWKGWLMGYPSYVVPTSMYYHKGGATLGEHSTKAIYLLWRNGLRNLIKYPEAKQLLTMAPLHVAFSLAVYLRIFLPLKRYRLILAMLAAYGMGLVRLPWLLVDRRTYQAQRKISDQELRDRGLLLNLPQSLGLSRAFMRRRAELAGDAQESQALPEK
jgi:GT2 family glycosyltransferase